VTDTPSPIAHALAHLEARRDVLDAELRAVSTAISVLKREANRLAAESEETGPELSGAQVVEVLLREVIGDTQVPTGEIIRALNRLAPREEKWDSGKFNNLTKTKTFKAAFERGDWGHWRCRPASE